MGFKNELSPFLNKLGRFIRKVVLPKSVGVATIGQQEVYDFLTQHKGTWFTSRDISEQLNVSIGSVTMSLKKLRKTNLIKYRNTGVRNTFIYTVEPEGVTVPPPPGVADVEEEEAQSRPKTPAKNERIIPKMVLQEKRVPIVVPRKLMEAKLEPVKAKPSAKKAKPKKAEKAAKKKVKKTIKKVKKTVKKTNKKLAKTTKKTVKKLKKATKKAVKSTKRVAKKAKKTVKKSLKKRAIKKTVKKAAKRISKTTKRVAKKIVKATPAKKGLMHRIFGR